MIHGIRNLDYKDRLKRLQLHSLERRRLRGYLIEVHKQVRGFNKRDISKILIVSGPGRTRTNGYKLEKFRFKKEIGKNWFTNRVVDEWNRLSNHVVSAKFIGCFKNGQRRQMVVGVFRFTGTTSSRPTGLLQSPYIFMFLRISGDQTHVKWK